MSAKQGPQIVLVAIVATIALIVPFAAGCASHGSGANGGTGASAGSGSAQGSGGSSGTTASTTGASGLSGSSGTTTASGGQTSGAGTGAGASTGGGGSTSGGSASGAATGVTAGSSAATGATSGSGDAGAPLGDAAMAMSSDGGYHKYVCPPGPFPAPVGTNRQLVCNGFKPKYVWNEGPVWIASQSAFFFSNFEFNPATNYNGDIIKYTPATDHCEIWLANAGTNGLGVAPDGNLLAAVNTTQSISEFDLVTRQPKIIVDRYMGKHFNSPNDLIVHSNGTIYFTDPDYQRGNRAQELPLAAYRIDPTGAISLIVTAKEPNGITLSPDEKHLYLDQDTGGGVSVIDLDANGVPVSAPRPFAGVTDGLTVDCAGNVYLSSDGGIYNPSGTLIGAIPGGGGTMPTFGGADRMTLIVVGGGPNVALGMTVSTVQYNLPGVQ